MGDLSGSQASANGWCVKPYSKGEVKGSLVAFIGIEICREYPRFGDGTLSFRNGQELEVVVAERGRELWRWSANQSADGQAHDVLVPAGHCYLWRTTWNGTTSDGGKLPAADYDVVATVVAANQAGLVAGTTTRVVP